jgi:hypothetical protein
MPAADVYHNVVKNALIKDGWTITHDPYTLTFGQRNVFVDLGAERLVAAEKGQEKIAVEIKSFLGTSDVRDLEMHRSVCILSVTPSAPGTRAKAISGGPL